MFWYHAAELPRVRSRSIRMIYWLVLAVSAILAFAAVWILVPAPNALLLSLGVGAPELSPVLFAISLMMVAVAAFYGRALGTARLALVFSLVSSILCVLPLLQVPSTLRRFDESMKRGIGVEAPGSRFSYSDLF